MKKLSKILLSVVGLITLLHIVMTVNYGSKICLNENNSIHFASHTLQTIAFDLSDTGSNRYIRGRIEKYGIIENVVYGYLDADLDEGLEGLKETTDVTGYFIVELLKAWSYSTEMADSVVSGLTEREFLDLMRSITDQPLKFKSTDNNANWWSCVFNT